MSASSRPTRRPCACRARARLVATVDLPTPPLPLATATTCLTPGKLIFCGVGPGGCMEDSLKGRMKDEKAQVFFILHPSAFSLSDALWTLAEGAQAFERVQA